MSELSDYITQECAACGALIDISDEEPLALMHCPTCGTSMRVRRMFGNFEPVEVLGAGGMGAVYRAQDLALNRPVALKLLRREYSEHPEVTRQFEHEAAITALINHPNVVKVYSTGSDHGTFYIAMELVDKGSLDDLMALQKKITEAQMLEVGLQIAQGLRAAFQSGLIHRDIKPGNILFAQAHHAKIVDFGLAASLENAGEIGGEVWGTPYYVAPEKLETPSREDARSDIYSLGATLFHALAGRPPHDAKDASIPALRQLKSQPVRIETFAPALSTRAAALINRMLQHRPEARPPNYDELIKQFEAVRLPPVVKPRAPTRVRPQLVRQQQQQTTMLSLVTVIALLALAAGAILLYTQRARLFPAPEPERVALGARMLQSHAKEQPLFEAARKLLLEEKPAEAAAAFRQLEAEHPQMAQPLLDWTTFHAGLATILAGQLDEAKADFAKLAKREAISQDPDELKLSQFFQKMAKLVLEEGPQAPEDFKGYQKDGYEALLPFLLAAKDWELGEFDHALNFFGDFELTNPEPPYAWIADYRTIAKKYDRQYDQYATFANQAKVLTDPEKAKAQLPHLREVLAGLNLQGALARKGRSVVRRVEQEVADFVSEADKAEMEMVESDNKALAEAEEKLKPLVAQFKFAEARDAMTAATAVTDKGKKTKAGLINKYDWLAGFKSTLTQDLGTGAYPGGLARKAGVRLAGSVSDATDEQVIVKVGGANVGVPWTDIAYESLVAMAQSYCRTDLPPDRLGDRLWLIGVFAAVEGNPADATKFFGLAIKQKPSYQSELVVFPTVPAPAA